jgi:glycosyltransferase involved in cell wall biosynthesis
MNILLSAFACAPGQGSEPGLGWGVARSVAARHRVWVLTHAYHKAQIEPALQASPSPNLRFIYLTGRLGVVPEWDRGGIERGRGHVVYGFYVQYLSWQLEAARAAQALHATQHLDLIHHVSYANSWLPSAMGWLDPPFVWTAGARERTPRAFLTEMSRPSRIAETKRNMAMTAFGPLTHVTTATRADLILTSSDPSAWSRRLPVREFALGGISQTEFDRLARIPERRERPFRLASIGRLLGLKAFSLGLRAFAELRREIGDCEYWIVGSGPEEGALKDLALELGCAESVRFWGWLPREQVLELLANVDVLVHPSLHEQFGYVLLEAMAAGRPVICLAAGGPTGLVGTEGGVVLPARTPAQVVRDMLGCLRQLAFDEPARLELGQRARRWVENNWTWQHTSARLLDCYDDALVRAARA